MTKIQTTLMNAINEDGVVWADIVKAVSAKHKVSNWMTVRNNLQGLINAGLVARLPSVLCEAYVKC